MKSQSGMSRFTQQADSTAQMMQSGDARLPLHSANMANQTTYSGVLEVHAQLIAEDADVDLQPRVTETNNRVVLAAWRKESLTQRQRLSDTESVTVSLTLSVSHCQTVSL